LYSDFLRIHVLYLVKPEGEGKKMKKKNLTNIIGGNTSASGVVRSGSGVGLL
jgi:hypothetical protein